MRERNFSTRRYRVSTEIRQKRIKKATAERGGRKMSQELQPVYAGEVDATVVEGGEQNSFLNGITGQTPWCIVSVLRHALIITLAALLSVAIELPEDYDVTQTVTLFEQPK